MSFTNQTTHYGLPQWIGSDKPTYLVDQNNAYQTIDAEIYNANTTAGAAQTAAEGAVQTAGAASTTAADALTAAQTASSTADNALTEAQTANTNAQAAQTAAGAAQTAAQAAQEAAAGNSITNLAPAYDPTITYNVDDLVTAEGKLYKCIVAVTSPEQFDINKWDDVTTSEVYVRSKEIISRHRVSATADTSVTNQQYLDTTFSSLLNTIKNSLGENQIAIINHVIYDYLNLYPVFVPDITPTTDFTNSYFEFDGVYGNTTDMYRGDIRKYVNESFVYFGTHFTGTTVSYSDKTSDSASDVGLTLDYYIISTRS